MGWDCFSGSEGGEMGMLGLAVGRMEMEWAVVSFCILVEMGRVDIS